MHGIDTCPCLPPPLLRTKVQSIRACVNEPGTSLKANVSNMFKPSEIQQKHATSQQNCLPNLIFACCFSGCWSLHDPSCVPTMLLFSWNLLSHFMEHIAIELLPCSYPTDECPQPTRYDQANTLWQTNIALENQDMSPWSMGKSTFLTGPFSIANC